MTFNEEQLKRFTEEMEYDQDRELRDALASIAKAEAELQHIRTQLVEAAAGHPYLRVGTIRGVDAGKVFRTFGTIERLASFRKITSP